MNCGRVRHDAPSATRTDQCDARIAGLRHARTNPDRGFFGGGARTPARTPTGRNPDRVPWGKAALSDTRAASASAAARAKCTRPEPRPGFLGGRWRRATRGRRRRAHGTTWIHGSWAPSGLSKKGSTGRPSPCPLGAERKHGLAPKAPSSSTTRSSAPMVLADLARSVSGWQPHPSRYARAARATRTVIEHCPASIADVPDVPGGS